jgi:peptide-methionine (S)-S-oxide reductase
MIKWVKNSLLLLFAGINAHAQEGDLEQSKTFREMNAPTAQASNPKTAVATFGAGCYWCTEAQFQQLKGVEKVESGFSGGHVAHPTYRQVCTGTTGHAEVCNIYYDPSVISFDELLAAFWTCHDPTQLNRQGNDVGTQYRSAIFYHDAGQMQKAEEYKKKLNEEHVWDKPVVTEIVPFTVFYKAEDYHQDYYNQNGEQPYCQFVVRPKLEKFKKIFKDKLKDSK